MPRNFASKVQILSVKHKGLLQAVDRMFDEFATLKQVQEMIVRDYGEKISWYAVKTYKNHHWKVQKEKLEERKRTMKLFADLIGEDGLSAGVNALLWQALQTMTPTQLLAFKRVANDTEKVALMKKRFALFAEEHRQKMKERRSAEKAGEVTVVDAADDYARAQRVVAQVKEIFGIGMSEIVPPPQRLLGAGEGEAPPVAADNPAPVGPEQMPSSDAPASADKESAENR